MLILLRLPALSVFPHIVGCRSFLISLYISGRFTFTGESPFEIIERISDFPKECLEGGLK